MIISERKGDRVYVSFRYDPDIVLKVKSVCGSWWHPDIKMWSFPTQYEFMMVEMFGDDYEATDAIREKSEADPIKLFDVPDFETEGLFEHQVDGIKWLLRRRKGILADDMGLGKTRQALIASKTFGLPIVVLCPASLKTNWLREAESVGVRINCFSWSKQPEFIKRDFVLIADEAHYVQNWKSKRTRNFLDLAKNKHCIAKFLLTGTPMKNGRPQNLLPLLRAVDSPTAKNKNFYEQRFCGGRNGMGSFHMEELKERTEDYILRRTKSECLDLPEKIRTIVQVDATKKDKNEYEKIIQQLCIESDSSENSLKLLQFERHASSKAKIPHAIKIAEDVLESGPVVIFTVFRHTAFEIAKSLGSHGVSFLTGETKVDDRQKQVDLFQNRETNVFVSTIGAGGVGLTLTRAQDVILVDRPWTPGDAEQAEDRCHRIGQVGTVNIQWLQLPFGIDKYIDNVLERKEINIGLMLEPAEIVRQIKEMI